jgi:hypothetical protein
MGKFWFFTNSVYVVAVVICLVAVCPQHAAADSIQSGIVGGGAGISTGGLYTLIGTVAQPDVAASTGGNYEIRGGFLSRGQVCTITLEDFANFAKSWLNTGIDLPADLYVDSSNKVNNFDLAVFAQLWLTYCPFGWELKNSPLPY